MFVIRQYLLTAALLVPLQVEIAVLPIVMGNLGPTTGETAGPHAETRQKQI